MGIREFFHNTILRMDLLSSSPGLRVRKEPSYQTFFGGIFSFLLMVGFGYVLYVQFQNMLNNLQNMFTEGLSDDIDSSTSISNLQLAVSIDGVDLSHNTKKFIFFLKQNRIASVNGTPTIVKTDIALSPCVAEDWSSLGTSFTTQFEAFGFTKMLCIKSGESFEMTGYIGSPNYAYLSLQVVECDQSKDATCDTPANINNYMTNYLTNTDYFKVRFFLADTIITPDNTDPVTYILEKNIFMAFTQTIGTVGYINMAQWTLTTDSSPYPMESNTEQTGSFIQSFQTNSVSISSNRYVSVDFFKSTKAKSITRTIGKIDTVLSYVGGLFSLIFTGIAFFIASYSQMRYQLYVAEYTLKSQYKGQKIGESSFGFTTYVGYCIYDWLDTFGVAPKCFDRMASIHETREEACQQLDPVLILKRIKYLEDVSKVLLNQHKELALYLSEPMTLEQAQKMRRVMGYYQKTLSELDSSPLLEMVSQQEKMLEGVNSNAVNAVANIDAIEQKKQMTQQQQQQMLEHLMKAAVSQLQRDNTQVGMKIKEKIGRRARQIILNKPVKKQTLTVQDFNEGIISPTMSPIYSNINESDTIVKKEKVKMVIKRQ